MKKKEKVVSRHFVNVGGNNYAPVRRLIRAQTLNDLSSSFYIHLTLSLLGCVPSPTDQYKVFFSWGLVFDLVRATTWTNLRWISHYSTAEITGRPIPPSDRNALIWRFITGRYFCVWRERLMIMWWSAIDGVPVAADDTLVTPVSSDLR